VLSGKKEGLPMKKRLKILLGILAALAALWLLAFFARRPTTPPCAGNMTSKHSQ